MLKNNKYYFIPVLNVDGLAYIEDNHASGEKFKIVDKRKNMDGSAAGDCDGTTLGVDLNRNYDASFNLNADYKASVDPCFEFYAGK